MCVCVCVCMCVRVCYWTSSYSSQEQEQEKCMGVTTRLKKVREWTRERELRAKTPMRVVYENGEQERGM
jgi:hypothetical protein